MAGDEDDEDGSKKEQVSGTSRLEWLAAAIGALILLSTIGYMAVYGLTQPDGPPKIALVQGPVEPVGDGYVMQFTVRNEGSSTAAALHVSGQLLDGGQLVEESEATIDYVPEHSEREGGLFFTLDPRQHGVSLRSEGYSKP